MDIRKADSKGRLTVGVAGAHYKIYEISASKIYLERVESGVAEIPSPLPEPAQNYLWDFGIDPAKVIRDTADEDGYELIQTGLDGKRLYTPDGRTVTTFHEWPDTFDWNEFLGHCIEVKEEA